jgi:hypothetical protein
MDTLTRALMYAKADAADSGACFLVSVADKYIRPIYDGLMAEIGRLTAIASADTTPKCWRLNEEGKLVRDVPVEPCMEVWILPWVTDGSPPRKVTVTSIYVTAEYTSVGLLKAVCREPQQLYSTQEAASAAEVE